MRTLLYYLFYTTTYAIALLPLKVLYVISDIVRFFTYHIFQYRRKVVTENLKNSFPEKTSAELKQIEEAFYKHFCDLLIETVYLLHTSKRNAMKMCKFNNIEILQKYYPQGKSVILATGHYNNWEILNLFGYYLEHKVIGIYKPINNKKIEAFINKYREQYGAIAVPMHDAFRTVISYHQQKKLFFLGLISDQTPHESEIRYWTPFLNQETPVFLGVEKIAIKTNQPVFFCRISKVSRGKYEVDIDLLCENPKETKTHEITEMHVRALEKLIKETPEYWLWSHRRWKYKKVAHKNI